MRFKCEKCGREFVAVIDCSEHEATCKSNETVTIKKNWIDGSYQDAVEKIFH